MLNSYRIAVLLMIVFGAIGIQAARYQADEPSVACQRTLPSDDKVDAVVERARMNVNESREPALNAAASAGISKVAVNAAER